MVDYTSKSNGQDPNPPSLISRLSSGLNPSSVSDLSPQSFIGVYDGHGGSLVAEHVSEALHEHLLPNLPPLQAAAHDGVEDPEMQNQVTAVLVDAYHAIDSQLAERYPDEAADCGATAATALIRKEGGTRVVYAANVGDSRAIICRDGASLRLTYDHRATDEAEIKRVKDAGGFVFNKRVSGQLAVTRAFGHVNDKMLILGTPYTSRTVVDEEKDEALIIATDGLWDVMKEPDVCKWVTGGLSEGLTCQQIAEKLTAECMRRYSRDNICIVIVAL